MPGLLGFRLSCIPITLIKPLPYLPPFIFGSIVMPSLLTVYYGFAPTPFGSGLIGWTQEGIVMLHLQQTQILHAPDLLASEYPDCTFKRDDHAASALLEQVFQQGRPGYPKQTLKLALKGSPFQLKVWQGLRDIPFGEVRSYGALAESLGHPGAARAVGTAIAANTLAYLVPCHRVVRATGEPGQFRWGAELKVRMLAWEAQ
jgi:O-6-methylguanine DNA methyltransferase